MTPTRNPHLGLRRDGPRLWRFVDLETDNAVGEPYATRGEAFGDLDRYAHAGGWVDSDFPPARAGGAADASPPA